MIDRNALTAALRELSPGEPRLFRAPGRVNLIGEHTDYNDGFVLPMAIDRETVVAASPRGDRVVRARSLNAKETVEFDLDRPGEPRRGIWLDYVEGVARALESGGARLRGMDCVIHSDVPDGAGLSSSAALEMSFGLAIATISEVEIDRVALALAGQRAEHTYVGTMCGIMDQYIASLGRTGHALLIDCRTLEPTPIPLDLGETAVVICDSRVKHSLASSEYNQRRAECERGVEILRRHRPDIRALRDVSAEELERYAGELPEVVFRRCRHVVAENARTLAAAAALREGRLEEMGRLMYASHASLRDDYEVSCEELDALVEIASGVDGVLGSRMTGGGFGGCTVSLVHRSAVDAFRATVAGRYAEAFGKEPTVLISGASAGASEVDTRNPVA